MEKEKKIESVGRVRNGKQNFSLDYRPPVAYLTPLSTFKYSQFHLLTFHLASSKNSRKL